MSDKEYVKLSSAIQAGLDKAFIEMLKVKAALGQNVVVVDSEGNPIEISAKELIASV